MEDVHRACSQNYTEAEYNLSACLQQQKTLFLLDLFAHADLDCALTESKAKCQLSLLCLQ